MTLLDSFIAGIPKAELHLHIEGTLEPELMVAIGRRNGVALPYPDAESARKAYNFTDLQSFLDIYYRATAVLITEEDFYDLTLAYLKKAASQQVRHAEIFFDPQSHTARGIAFETVVRGVERALVEELVQMQVPLTVCPLSNVRLRVFSSMAKHNLKLMLQRGLCVTINSDDPAYFGGYINENYLEAAHALQLDRNDIIRLAQNSFAASSLSPLHKELYLKEIERYIARESC